MNKDNKFLIVGQPNSGKSSLINALIGSRVIISNYPGTTVEITKGKRKIGDFEIEFLDTPGIYSISDRSEEEKVTEVVLFREKVGGVIIICDATSLERSFYMVLQIMEAGIPTIIALNFVEEAERKGIEIDFKKLEEIFSSPVIAINPLTGRGIDKLMDSVAENINKPVESFKVAYDDHIEYAIDRVSREVRGDLSKRFVALRVLEEDKDFYKYLKDKDVTRKIGHVKEKHRDIAKDIAVTRFGTASFIAENATKIVSLKKERGIENTVDGIVLNKVWGPIITVAFFILMFGAILFLGGIIQDFLMGLTERAISFLGKGDQSALVIVLGQGLTGLAVGVSIALPYIFLFYLIIGFIEDTGLLTRFVINTERITNKAGLPGKSFIPLALGIGCTVPAIRATRVLSSKKEQFHAASLFAFIPCSSRIAIIMGIVGFFGGVSLAFYVYATLIIIGIIFALVLKKIFRTKAEPLILELPTYRKPMLKNVFTKSWIRMKDFVYIVMPLLVIFGMVYGILNVSGLTEVIIKPFSFITNWLGLPARTIIPLVFGFLQKDLTGAMLLSALGSNISQVLTPLQIYTFGVASSVGIPCIIVLGMLIREFGFKKAIILTVVLNIYGVLVAGLVWRIVEAVRNFF
ncbi:MAG: ferrous iron transport protein B [Actinomycetota bacterium]|nr:ferrous iron transport protein B [Actinomycetota bacterium]